MFLPSRQWEHSGRPVSLFPVGFAIRIDVWYRYFSFGEKATDREA
jgi:hypothetical protein